MSADIHNEIQKMVMKLYQKNLLFLKDNFQELYKDILDTEKKESNYFLELKDNLYFDIYDEKNKTFIHNVNTYTEAERRVQTVNFDSRHTINLLRLNQNTNNLVIQNELFELKKLVSHLNQNINFNDIKFEKFFKFIFIGTGIGLHIEKIFQKINPMNTLIVEPNIEIFRLSLFTCDYSQFQEGNKKLFLCIGKDISNLDYSLELFTEYHSYLNFNIKYHLFSIKDSEYLEKIKSFYSRSSPIDFPYLSSLEMAKRTFNFMNEKKYFINTNKTKNEKPLYSKKVLIIAAGPSLDDNIKWIKNNQNKFVIICVDVILRKLEKNNIIPDIVVSIDPHHIVNTFFETKNKDFLKDSSIIFLSQQHEKVINTVTNLNFYFLQSYMISNELGIALSSSNVGTFSMYVAYILEAKEIYTIGTDAAFNQKTGLRYADDSSAHDFDNLKNVENSKNMISLSDTIITKGNLTDSVETTRDLIRFKHAFEYLIKYFMNNKNFKLYNLSNGAYIEGLSPINIETIEIDKFDEIDKLNISKSLKECSQNEFSDIDFSKDIEIVNKILEETKKYRAKKFKSKDDLQKSKIDFLIWTLNEKKSISGAFINDIFLRFIDLIDIYYNFALNVNQKDLYTKNYLKKVHQYWCDSLIDLLERIIQDFKS